MFKSGKSLLLAAAMSTLLSSAAWADGLISIIVNDPANPYWLTEGNVAKATENFIALRLRFQPKARVAESS